MAWLSIDQGVEGQTAGTLTHQIFRSDAGPALNSTNFSHTNFFQKRENKGLLLPSLHDSLALNVAHPPGVEFWGAEPATHHR